MNTNNNTQAKIKLSIKPAPVHDFKLTGELHNYLIDAAKKRSLNLGTKGKREVMDQHEFYLGAITTLDFITGEVAKGREGKSHISPRAWVAIIRGELIEKIVCLFIFILSLSFTTTAQQKVTIDAKGNYSAIQISTQEPYTKTGKTFTDSKGIVYPVFISKNNKVFYFRTSKTGNVYRVYIKVN